MRLHFWLFERRKICCEWHQRQGPKAEARSNWAKTRSRPMFRFSGSKRLELMYRGSTIQRLRAETGADIQVGRDDDLITITGGKSYLRPLCRQKPYGASL